VELDHPTYLPVVSVLCHLQQRRDPDRSTYLREDVFSPRWKTQAPGEGDPRYPRYQPTRQCEEIDILPTTVNLTTVKTCFTSVATNSTYLLAHYYHHIAYAKPMGKSKRIATKAKRWQGTVRQACTYCSTRSIDLVSPAVSSLLLGSSLLCPFILPLWGYL